MLSKAHLTSHSRVSGSRSVITRSWLSGSWRSFLYSSSVYACHVFLISSASVRALPFLSFIEPIFAWNVPLVSLIFLKRFLVFPILLFSSISLHSLLKKAVLSLLAIVWNSEFKWRYLSFSPLLFASLLFSAICKASSDSHFAFLHFFFLGMVLIPVCCTTSVVHWRQLYCTVYLAIETDQNGVGNSGMSNLVSIKSHNTRGKDRHQVKNFRKI